VLQAAGKAEAVGARQGAGTAGADAPVGVTDLRAVRPGVSRPRSDRDDDVTMRRGAGGGAQRPQRRACPLS
jgi:hypothetical protein